MRIHRRVGGERQPAGAIAQVHPRVGRFAGDDAECGDAELREIIAYGPERRQRPPTERAPQAARERE